jgi:phosphonate transport system ATP-binding protein
LLKLFGFFPKEEVERAMGALRAVGLENKSSYKVKRLSGGEKQRVAVARALVRAPRLIFADEPVSNLDPPKAKRVLKLFYELAKSSSIAVLCSLHTPELAEEHADRFLGVKDGKVVVVDETRISEFYV